MKNKKKQTNKQTNKQNKNKQTNKDTNIRKNEEMSACQHAGLLRDLLSTICVAALQPLQGDSLPKEPVFVEKYSLSLTTTHNFIACHPPYILTPAVEVVLISNTLMSSFFIMMSTERRYFSFL